MLWHVMVCYGMLCCFTLLTAKNYGQEFAWPIEMRHTNGLLQLNLAYMALESYEVYGVSLETIVTMALYGLRH